MMIFLDIDGMDNALIDGMDNALIDGFAMILPSEWPGGFPFPVIDDS